MMKRSLLTTMLTVIVVIVSLILPASKGVAQPTNYCNPYCSDQTNTATQFSCSCNNYYTTYITNVRITNNLSGEVVLQRSSMDDANCYFFDETDEAVLHPAESYTLSIQRYNNEAYDNLTIVYIDWNADGDFFDSGLFTNPTVNEKFYTCWGYGYSTYTTNDYSFTVPEDVPDNQSRMRIITSYGYDYGPCCVGYCYLYTYSNSYSNSAMGEAEDYKIKFEGGIRDVYPTDGDILYANELYDNTYRPKNGQDVYFQRPGIIFGSAQPAGAKANFRISGPLPANTVVYEGLDPDNGSTDIEIGGVGTNYPIELARGSNVRNNSDFIASRGGTYKTYAHLVGKPREVIKRFTVSWDNDVAVVDIVSPRTNGSPKYFKYPANYTMSVQGSFTNVGLNDVTSFDAFYEIYNSNGVRVRKDSTRFNSPPKEILHHNDNVLLNFINIRLTEVGIYHVKMWVNLLSANDQDRYNDTLPRSDMDPYTIEIAHQTEVASSKVVSPSLNEILRVGRTITPWAEFKNNGIGDVSDVPAKMWVTKTSGGPAVYTSTIKIQDIQSGKYNTKTERFDDMVINQGGDYKVCVELFASDDPVRNNDTICSYFHVEEGLSGVYTVGNTFAGQARNFPTIDSAMNALYYQGLQGSVALELTDATYNWSAATPVNPALDMTSRIIGLGYNSTTQQTNTLTIRAARNRASQRGGVQVNLTSQNGRGIEFGQNLFATNKYALVKQYMNKTNANSAGYITFDGGSQKALHFTMYSGSSAFAAAFYLGRGSQNITIKNCLIDNGTSEKNGSNVWVPLNTYSPALSNYIYDNDTSGTGINVRGYSAGIASRHFSLSSEMTNFLKLDILSNSNNTFDGNEISGFGYGISSLGLGTQLDANTKKFVKIYNSSNTISNNLIHDVYRAGILLGYEMNSNISGNRIFTVGNEETDAYGIMAGGNSRGNTDGYNTIGLNITGNEISNILSPSFAEGIHVEQVRITYPNPSGGEYTFPDVPENTTISNNIIWGINPANIITSKAGIRLLTARDTNGTWVNRYTSMRNKDYVTRGDRVINNTIIISNDGSTMNFGAVLGISVQQSVNPVIMNNAIAIQDNTIDQSSPLVAAILYQGRMPKEVSMVSDRNAFWLGNSNAALFRFIQTDAKNNIIENGQRNEFMTLNQWQTWTGNDMNSIIGDFTRDMSTTGVNPQKLRVTTTPQAPLGSILNNRGQRITDLKSDINGTPRGVAGQRYDIGAVEFDGRMYVSDVELVTMQAPSAYITPGSNFTEGEYIMTTAPCEVTSRLRNNGSLQQSDIDVNVNIYLELPQGGFGTTAELSKTVRTSIPSTESIDVTFGLAKGLPNDFMPKTYGDLKSTYTVPTKFASMINNVTPLYKIVVNVGSDQNNANNSITKYVRFYLKRSDLSLLVSTENSMTNIIGGEPSQDEIAGRLNSDSLLTGLKRLGWFTDVETKQMNVDVFDRLSWEPRSINYGMYHTMFWADGDDKPLTRYQRADIEKFLNAGSVTTEKKNLIIGSQEMVRVNSQPAYYDEEFLTSYLRSQLASPGNPLGTDVSNDGNIVRGLAVGKDLTSEISATDFEGDTDPYCGLMKSVATGDGLAQSAFQYINFLSNAESNVMGVSTVTLTRNIVNLGVDWRHFENLNLMLRSVLDFVDKNQGAVVAVNLAEFKATPVGKKVNLTWRTETEYQSSHFEIERTSFKNGSMGDFMKIDQASAAGTSPEPIEYGPVADEKVEYGESYAYRLKMVDLDGSFKYSDVQIATIDNLGITLDEAVPNPSYGNTVRFGYKHPASIDAKIKVIDASGREVSPNLSFNGNEILLDMKDLASGAYTLILSSGDLVLTRNFSVLK